MLYAFLAGVLVGHVCCLVVAVLVCRYADPVKTAAYHRQRLEEIAARQNQDMDLLCDGLFNGDPNYDER